MPRENGRFTNAQVRQRIRAVTARHMGRGGGTNLRLAWYAPDLAYIEGHADFNFDQNITVTDSVRVYTKISEALNDERLRESLTRHHAIVFLHKFNGKSTTTRQVIVIYLGSDTVVPRDVTAVFSFDEDFWAIGIPNQVSPFASAVIAPAVPIVLHEVEI